MKYLYSLLFIGFFISINCQNSTTTQTRLKGAYLGETPPGNTPKLFAPGMISTGCYEKGICFSPDGNELYYSIYGAPFAVIVSMKNMNGFWTKPQITSFSNLSAGEFTLSPDGNRLYFLSKRPIQHGKNELEKEAHFWITQRINNNWSEPQLAPEPFCNMGYISEAVNGNLYYFSYDLAKFGKADILMSEYENGQYSDPINLGSTINSEYYDVDPFIAPDESYLIFCSNRKPGGLYISFKNTENNWTPAKYMGDTINTNTGDGPICPFVTRDEKYLFYTFNRRKNYPVDELNLTYDRKIEILNSAGNGQNDIYWVSADIIKQLKPKDL